LIVPPVKASKRRLGRVVVLVGIVVLVVLGVCSSVQARL
jgi:hypothetical protein